MTTMHRLSADRFESLERPKLLGSSEHSVRVAEPPAPDPMETQRIQQKLLFDEARDHGFTEGMRSAEYEISRRVANIEDRLRSEHDAALTRLQSDKDQFRQMASSLQASLDDCAESGESLAIEVAFASVTRLLGEKSADRSLMRDLCRNIVLEYGFPPATLRVSEADMPLLESVDLGIRVEADRRLMPGQCVIDTARGQFESGLDVRLDALRKTLLAAMAEHRSQS